MSLPIRELSQQMTKARSNAARVGFADVTSVDPVMVTFDQGESEVPAYVAAGVATVVGSRVAVLKHGNAPGIILGLNIDKPSGVTGDWIAADTITAANMQAGIITARELAVGSIEAKHIKAGTITATEIAAGSITTELLAAEAVTAGKIKAGTITSSEIASATITSGNIASGTITGSNIAGATITASKITISELSALSANLGTITAGTVTGATLQTATSGKRVVIDSSGLKAFNATEAVLDFDVATGNLKLKGTVEAGSSIPASTITGQLTNAQLQEIEAAKITGKLIGSQVNSDSIVFDIVTAVPIAGQMGFSKNKIEPYEFQLTANSETKYLVVKDKDKTGRELDGFFQSLASAGEPFNARITLTSAEDSSQYAIFKVTSGTENIVSQYYRWGVELVKTSGEWENGEECYFSFSSGALVADSITANYIAAGAITSSELSAGSVVAGKIAAGTIVSGDIAAGEIKATNIAADAIESKHIKAEAVESSDIKANTIVAGNIAASTITATQIASETITGAKIAAGTIAATKLTVSELSAITANLGTITAGTITGATFRTSGDETVLNSEGLHIKEATTGSPGSLNTIEWREGSTPRESLAAYLLSERHTLRLSSYSTAHNAHLYIRSHPSDTTKTDLLASANAVDKILINESGESSYLQLTETAKRVVHHGGISAAGAKVAGSTGWTCEKVSTGLYKIKFSPAFTVSPHVTFSVAETGERIPLRVQTATTSEATYYTVNTKFEVADAATHFMAIG